MQISQIKDLLKDQNFQIEVDFGNDMILSAQNSYQSNRYPLLSILDDFINLQNTKLKFFQRTQKYGIINIDEFLFRKNLKSVKENDKNNINQLCNIRFYKNQDLKNDLNKNFEKLNQFEKEGICLLINSFFKEINKISIQFEQSKMQQVLSYNFALVDHQIKQLFGNLDFNEKKEQLLSELMAYFNFENYQQLWSLPNILQKNQHQYQEAIKDIQKSIDLLQQKITNENHFVQLRQKLKFLSQGFSQNNSYQINQNPKSYTFLPYQQIYLQSQKSETTKTNLSQDSKIIMQNIDYENSVFDFDQTRIDECTQQLQDLGQYVKFEKDINKNKDTERLNQLENYFQNYQIDIKNWPMDHVQDILNNTFERSIKNQNPQYLYRYQSLFNKFQNFSLKCYDKFQKIQDYIVNQDNKYYQLFRVFAKKLLQKVDVKKNSSNQVGIKIKIKRILKIIKNFDNILNDLDKQEEKLEFFNIHVEDVMQEFQDNAQQEKIYTEQNIFTSKEPELIKLKLQISKKAQQIDKLKQELTQLKNQQRFAFQKRFNPNIDTQSYKILCRKSQQNNINFYKNHNSQNLQRKLQKLRNKILYNSKIDSKIVNTQQKFFQIQRKLCYLIKILHDRNEQDDISSIEKQSVDFIELDAKQQQSLKKLNPIEKKIQTNKPQHKQNSLSNNIKKMKDLTESYKNQQSKSQKKRQKSSLKSLKNAQKNNKIFQTKQEESKQDKNINNQIRNYIQQIEELEQENFHYKEQILDLKNKLDQFDLENQKLSQSLLNMISDINNIILKPKFDFITQEEQLLKPLQAIYEKIAFVNQKNIFLKSEVQNLVQSQDSRKDKRSSIFGNEEPNRDQQHSQMFVDFKNIFEHYLKTIFDNESKTTQNIQNIKKILIQLQLPDNLGLNIMKEIKEIINTIKNIEDLLQILGEKGQQFFNSYDIQNFEKLQAENAGLYEKVEKLQLEFNSIKNLFQDTVNIKKENKSNSFSQNQNIQQQFDISQNSITQSQESRIESQQEIEPLIENSLYSKKETFIDECLKQLQKNDKESRQRLYNLCQKFKIEQFKKFKRYQFLKSKIRIQFIFQIICKYKQRFDKS